MNNSKESVDNMLYMCSECAEQKLKDFQKQLGDKVIPIPCWAKIAFTEPTDEHNVEHMWVHVVKEPVGNKFFGTLDNDPFHVTHVHYNDVVFFDRCEIEDLNE